MEDYKFDDKFARDPFKVPENYFDDFVSRMDARIAEEMELTKSPKRIKGRSIDFARLATLVASSVAVFAGLLVGGFTLMNMQQEVDAQAEEIMAQEVYVEEMLEMLDLHQIELALAEAEFYENAE